MARAGAGAEIPRVLNVTTTVVVPPIYWNTTGTSIIVQQPSMAIVNTTRAVT